MAGICLGVLGAFSIAPKEKIAPVASPAVSSTDATAPEIEKRAGPWGEIQLTDIQIERPDGFIANLRVPEDHGVWFFGAGYDRSRILQLFKSADLTQSQRHELTDVSRWASDEDGVRVTPPPETVLKLSRTARSQIYRVLGEFQKNFFQFSPFKFPQRRSKEWFFHCGLKAETVSLIQSLLYEQGGMLCFSDMQVFHDISSDEEKAQFIKTMSRSPAVLASLRAGPETDLVSTLRFWSRNGNSSVVQPLIVALAQKPKGGAVDISHLLPGFVRDRLFTYPNPPIDGSLSGPDCFWSALNFDEVQPDDRYLQPEFRNKRLSADFEPVRSAPQLGDILLFQDRHDQIIHACVHVAGPIVFTKNGANIFAPWILMRLEDVIGYYSSERPPKVLAFRRKRAASS